MRLSVVFELLLVFLFLAFAAARVIDPSKTTKNVAKGSKKTTTLRQGPPNRYCACTSRMCNCCRDFSLPVVPIKGPGCASIMYVQRDTMMVTMSFGDRVLSNTTITGKNPRPICMALPGGISQFCGRVYGISRKGDQFRACLGLELRALDDIEAALRVSCFKFGPKGVKLESAPPVPAQTGGKDPDEEEDDDDDYLDDDDDDLIGFGVDEDDGASSEDNEVDSDSVDYTGFSVLGEDILGTLFSDDSGSTKKKKPNKKTARPQVIVPKVSTTTRRPVFPVRRRSTVRPEKATNKPVLNRLTKRPASSNIKPVIITKAPPVVSHSTVYSTSLPVYSTVVTKTDHNKIITKVTAAPTASPTTTTTTTTTTQAPSTTVQEEKVTVVQTEQPVTFTLPPQKVEVVKNEIKIPQIDLAKVEAVAAIAQQDIASGVISSTSVTSEETEKPLEMVTVKYVPEKTTSYMPQSTEKINSVKFVPTTVVTSRPSAELMTEDDLLDSTMHTEVVTLSGIKKRITTQSPASEEDSDEEEEEESDEEVEDEEDDDEEEAVGSNKIDKNTHNKKGNFTISLKKQPVKLKQDKPGADSDDEDVDDDDLLEDVLSDNEEAEEEEEEEDDDDNNTESEKNKEEDEDDEETGLTQKPTKVSVKKKPPKESDEEEEEEEEEEEDILDVLADDDDDEESEDDDDEEVDQKKKKKVTTKRPPPHKTTQDRKPVTTTEKVVVHNTTKYIVYQQPVQKVTEKEPEKVVMYQQFDNKNPNKVFVYQNSPNKVQETTEKIIFYNEPVEIATQKFVIYKEPLEKVTVVQATTEETEEVENDEDNSSEEDSDEEGEKHTLVASIAKPGFSNKYAEEHDLTDSDDLDIEDAEEEGNDFEEDRKLKQEKKPSAEANPKLLTLSDLIGQRKKHYDNKPVSTSRTHRRMNLDRLLQV